MISDFDLETINLKISLTIEIKLSKRLQIIRRVDRVNSGQEVSIEEEKAWEIFD